MRILFWVFSVLAFLYLMKGHFLEAAACAVLAMLFNGARTRGGE
jgi:hypothetical protein